MWAGAGGASGRIDRHGADDDGLISAMTAVADVVRHATNSGAATTTVKPVS